METALESSHWASYPCRKERITETTSTSTLFASYKEPEALVTRKYNLLPMVILQWLYYKPEGRGFETRRGEFLNSPNLSGSIRPWGSFSL
jgi:hypothetical protein